MNSVHSVAMIKHSMTIVKEVVQHLNPGQAPLLTADQPLFALAKQIQRTLALYTKRELQFLLSGFQIETAILRVSEFMHLHKLSNMHFVHRYRVY